MRRFFELVRTTVFPRCCSECGEALRGQATQKEWEYLCPVCAQEVQAVGEEACVKCGVPVYGVVSGTRVCSVCKATPPKWGAARSLLRYRGPVRRWVKDYKYSDARWVEREWEKLLTAGQFAWVREFVAGAVVVPVPLHPIKKWWRGVNQAENLARAFVRVSARKCPGIGEVRLEIGGDGTAQGLLSLEGQAEAVKRTEGGQNLAQVRTDILWRVRWTAQQAKLSREKRDKNVKNAFDIAPKVNIYGLKSRRVVVVDDLLTTGATLSACVQALKHAGFERVDVLTFARG